jgi:hypothetical protein
MIPPLPLSFPRRWPTDPGADENPRGLGQERPAMFAIQVQADRAQATGQDVRKPPYGVVSREFEAAP